MKNYLSIAVLVFALGFGGFAATLSAQTDSSGAKKEVSSEQSPAQLNQKVEELTALVKQLQAEMVAMKHEQAPRPQGVAEVASTAMPPLPASASLAAEASVPLPQTAPAPEKLSLAGLLGPTTISGFVDTYYGYNSNQPANRTTALRNFDINSGQFALNMLEFVVDKPVSTDTARLGYHVAFGFGQAMNLVNSTEVSSPLTPGTPGGAQLSTISNFDQYLKEGYLEYLAPVGKGLQINVGKFVTPAGAEVIESKDNWNYSRGLLFSWAIPYFHYGVSAKYAFNSKFALTGYLVNGWNNSVDNNSGKTTGFTAAWTPTGKFTFIENYLVGPEQGDNNGNFRHLTDTVMIYNPTAKLSLMANYDYGHDTLGGPGAGVWWSGIAGYIKYAPNDKWALATRGEWFKDHDGFETGTAQNLGEVTFTLQRAIASKIISRLEYRYDTSDQNVFPYHTSSIPGSLDSPLGHQNTATVSLIYAFTSADAK
jgi:hypothetical protein